MNASITLETINQSILFARLANAAYLNTPAANVAGLKKLKNELRFRDGGTDTQGVAGRWNKDIVIAFRGTELKFADWVGTNAKVGLVQNPRGIGQMHSGFRRSADSVFQTIKRFIRNHKDDDSRIFLCGHSLGGALAIITAAWLVNDSRMPTVRAVFTYGAPRIGDAHFAAEYGQLRLDKFTKMWVSERDPVPRIPPFAFGYRHVTKSQPQLGSGALGRTSLDAKAKTELEREWLRDLPVVKTLYWFARRMDDGIHKLDVGEHHISKSYLRQLKKVKKSLQQNR